MPAGGNQIGLFSAIIEGLPAHRDASCLCDLWDRCEAWEARGRARALVLTTSSITTGPDGALWYTNNGDSTIGRITVSGVAKAFTSTKIFKPIGITTGPDGALWFTNFTTRGSIGRITTSGTVTTYTRPAMDGPASITVGPDKALWFTGLFGPVGRITTGGQVTFYRETCCHGGPEGIVTGPDHNLWITNISGSIARLTPAGQFTDYTVPNKDEPWDLTSGPGGLWFSVIRGPFGGAGAIDRFTIPARSQKT
jgi:virginiamycin B lyase